MYVCMYVCVYVCIHALTVEETTSGEYAENRLCMYVCMCVYVCIHALTVEETTRGAYAENCLCMYVCMCVCMYPCIDGRGDHEGRVCGELFMYVCMYI